MLIDLFFSKFLPTALKKFGKYKKESKLTNQASMLF